MHYSRLCLESQPKEKLVGWLKSSSLLLKILCSDTSTRIWPGAFLPPETAGGSILNHPAQAEISSIGLFL